MAPRVNPTALLATGVTELRLVFPSDQITGVLLAYMEGIRAAFAVGIAMAGMAFLISLFGKWNRIHVQL
jgi:MFS transporter, DHA2 family, glioxin efflux transporter